MHVMLNSTLWITIHLGVLTQPLPAPHPKPLPKLTYLLYQSNLANTQRDMSFRHGHSLSSPASLEPLRARDHRDSTARLVSNTTPPTNVSSLYYGMDFTGYEQRLESCSPVLSIPRQRLLRSSRSLGKLEPTMFNQPFLTAGAGDVSGNAYGRKEGLGARDEASSLGTFDQPYNTQHYPREEGTTSRGPSIHSRGDIASVWHSRSGHESRTEIGRAEILGGGGCIGLASWPSTAERAATGPFPLRQLGTSVPGADSPTLWESGETLESTVYNSPIHANVSNPSFTRPTRQWSVSLNRGHFNINVGGHRRGTTASPSRGMGEVGDDKAPPHTAEQLLWERPPLRGKLDGGADVEILGSSQGEALRPGIVSNHDFLQASEELQSRSPSTHCKTGMQSLPTTFGKDDSRSQGDEDPTTRDIIQYPGLFYEHGDDFAVCHSGKKGQGARDFKAFTDILEARGATLAHDGRYFSTPKLERYIRNATVSTAELSFGLPLKCFPPKRLLMHVAEWAA
jgi:hypothetical protein